MAHSSLVASRHIKAASLHSPLPFSARLYVWPFGLLYVAYAYAVISHDIDTIFGGSEGRNLALVILGSLNVLALLLTHWSVTLKAWMTCYSVSDPYWAKLIRVIPDKHHGKGELCEIKRQTVLDDETGMPQERLYFFFQQTKYLFNPEKRAFFKLEYPGSRPKPIGYFCESHGIAAEQEWRMAMDRYGPN